MQDLLLGDAKSAIIVLLCIILAIVLLKFLKKSKIKQSRYKSDSGDLVRSRAELVIANWLFYHGISFVYEKKTPTKERIVSDFYLVDFDIYIEFWGLESDNYIKRKKQKIKIYNKNRLRLIQIDDESLRDLSRFFMAEFCKFGILHKGRI